MKKYMTPALGMAAAASAEHDIEVGGAYQDRVEGDLRALVNAAMDAAMIEISLMEDDEVLQQG